MNALKLPATLNTCLSNEQEGKKIVVAERKQTATNFICSIMKTTINYPENKFFPSHDKPYNLLPDTANYYKLGYRHLY